MASQILLTMADLETAVPFNAALEAAGFTTAMVSPMDDAPAGDPSRDRIARCVGALAAVARVRDGENGYANHRSPARQVPFTVDR
jgi:hypothetical protein